MSSCHLAVLTAALLYLPDPGHAQAASSPGAALPSASADIAAATPRPNELTADVGILSVALSYARQVSDPVSLGIGLWGSWEPVNSFDRSVWEPIGVTAFARYRATPWLHAEVGPVAARYLWADDCSECSGTFVGIRSAAFVGHRFIFVGPDLSVGAVQDDRHGSDFGVMVGAQVRFLFGWGGN